MDISDDGDYSNRLRDVFDVCDTDRVGQISVDHLLSLARDHFAGVGWEASQEAISRIIKGLDSEGNGSINFEEFCEGVKRILELQVSGGNVTSSSAEGGDELDGVEDVRGGGGGANQREPEFDTNSCEEMSSEMSASCTDYDDVNNIDKMSPPSSALRHDASRHDAMMTGGPQRMTSTEDDVDSGFDGKTSEHLDINGGGSSGVRWPTTLPDDGRETFEYYGDGGGGGWGGGGDGVGCSLLDSSNPLSVRDALPSPRAISNIMTPQRPFSPRSGSRLTTPSAVASQLYRSTTASSPNMSRRSSISDGVYDDIDGNFVELNDKVKKLENQIHELTESQVQSQERNGRIKDENTGLIERVHLLEETIREMDSRSQEQIAEERRKYKELSTRTDKERSREIDILSQSLQHIEKEYAQLKQETPLLKSENEKLRRENVQLERDLSRLQQELCDVTEERTTWQQHARDEHARATQERKVQAQLIDELSKEVEELRLLCNEKTRMTPNKSEDLPRSARQELETQIIYIKEENARLREECEDLHTQLIGRDFQVGRSLLQDSTPSLADELDALPRDELMTALQKEREANKKLRDYVEFITLRILEKNPSILEIGPKNNSNNNSSK